MAGARFSDAFTFLPQGALIQEFRVGGKNIVLGFNSAATYRTANTPYFGETIGRVANRISGARINNLNSTSYPLEANNGPNTLHGGVNGWGKKIFEGPTPVNRDGREAVVFKYISPHGDEGFPGAVEVQVWYIASVEQDGGVDKTTLEIEYEARLVGDEVDETAVSITNHSYFNLSDSPTIEGTRAVLDTNLHLPVDSNSIPTGQIEPCPGIPAKQEFVMGPRDPDPDHCFIANPDPASVKMDSRPEPMRPLAHFWHPTSGIHLETLSTEPAFQFYAGRFIDVPAIDGQPARGPRSGFCLETGRYIDAVNNDQWRHMVVLHKGQTYGSRTIYRAWIEAK